MTSKILLIFRPVFPASTGNHARSWTIQALGWLAGSPWWTSGDKNRRTLAQLDDERLCDLSETGRQVRRDVLRRAQAHRIPTHQTIDILGVE